MSKTPNLDRLILKSLACFDTSVQDLILIEEMSELTKELLKRRRGSQNDSCIKEELTHVLTSLLVVKSIVDVSDEDIEQEAVKKLEKYGWLNSEKG